LYAGKRDDERQYALKAAFIVASLFLSSSLMMVASSWAPDAATTSASNVCLITADFWGAPAAGGTATAFELLARELQKEKISATLVGVSSSCESRENFIAAHRDLKSSAFLCKEYLDTPLEKETYPYEIAGHLAVQWLRSQESHCDIVHWHEWGGVAVPSLVDSEAGILHASKRHMHHIVQLHGGNLWASQHGTRPVDMTSLRIDANEKLSIELAHEITSPSKYIADWYGDRGWKMPEKVSVVPNCLSLPPLPFSSSPSHLSSSSSSKPLIKAVKTVAFFGRLESRKGIEIFFDAISLLGDNILSKPDFKVLIVGGSAQIRSQKSEEWICNRIKYLPKSLNASQVVLKVGLSREMALKEILEAETIISFGSKIENAPFALVEASKLGLPYVALDTGGVQEVVDLESSTASVLFNPLNLTETTVALASALEVRLRAGNAAVPKLRPFYEKGNKLWIKWHLNLAQEMHNQAMRPENRIAGSARSLLREKTPLKSEIIHVGDGPNALANLHKDACDSHGDPSQILLLLSSKSVEINEAVWLQQLLPTLAAKLDHKLHAVTLGVKVNNSNSSTMAFAGSPTWTYYSNQTLCTPTAPLAIRRKTLCSLRLLSRNFQRSDAWTLALLIKKAGMEVATLPVSDAAVLKEWQVQKCVPENPPAWSFDHDVTEKLRYDPQISLFTDLATLGKAPEPLTSFFSDSRYWKIFPESARNKNCDAPQLPVPPYFCNNILHPSSNTSAVASFKSWFSLDAVNLRAEVRACPSCAEGPLAVQVVVVRNSQKIVIWSHKFDAGGACDSKMLSIDKIRINAGDEIRLVATASRAGHSCAGIYVPAFDIYPFNFEQKLNR
jgi:glycosyltransferase involved in cell wall biosynthesis